VIVKGDTVLMLSNSNQRAIVVAITGGIALVRVGSALIEVAVEKLEKIS